MVKYVCSAFCSCITRSSEADISSVRDWSCEPHIECEGRTSLEELVEILQAFSEVTELMQGDNYVTVSCVVPSVVALLKYMAGLNSLLWYHGTMVEAHVESIRRCFTGLLQTLQIQPSSTTQQEPSEQLIYPAAAVMDPGYGFVWLECDHPGSAEIKATVKETVIGKNPTHLCYIKLNI